MNEVCIKCGQTYEEGNHEVDADGFFTPGGHYFVGEEEE